MKSFIAIAVSLMLLIFIAPVGAQQDKPETTNPQQDQPSMQSPDKNQRAEGEILAFLIAVDEHEVAAGKDASQKSTNPQVKQFAQTMVRDHGSHLEKTQKLVSTLNIQTRETPDIDQTKQEAEAARTKISALNGAAYDKEYIDQMVKDHAAALDHIDNHYMKATTNAQLLNHLKATRTAVAKHHEDAVRIQGMLK